MFMCIVYTVYSTVQCTVTGVTHTLLFAVCRDDQGQCRVENALFCSFALLLLSLYGSELLLSIFLKEPKSDSLFFNPNQSGIPADSKGVACWYFNTNFPRTHHWYSTKREKRLTLRARLRYLEN